MNKYRLDIKKDIVTSSFYSDSFLDIYNKYYGSKDIWVGHRQDMIEITFYSLWRGEWVEMDSVSDYLEDAKKQFIRNNWEQFMKSLDTYEL